MARVLQGELRDKLDSPALTLDFASLYAADLSGRARAYRSPGRTRREDPEADARRLAGLS